VVTIHYHDYETIDINAVENRTRVSIVSLSSNISISETPLVEKSQDIVCYSVDKVNDVVVIDTVNSTKIQKNKIKNTINIFVPRTIAINLEIMIGGESVLYSYINHENVKITSSDETFLSFYKSINSLFLSSFGSSMVTTRDITDTANIKCYGNSFVTTGGKNIKELIAECSDSSYLRIENLEGIIKNAQLKTSGSSQIISK
jgi:hypothetical protein